MQTLNIKVEGMACNHCKMNVERNLKSIEGISDVSADLQTNTVQIAGDEIDLDLIKTTVENLGYVYGGKTGGA